MTSATSQIIDAIIGLLETETSDVKAGNFARVGETAERKARLMLQLQKARPVDRHDAKTLDHIQKLQKALHANLRACKQNMETIRELIDLHLAAERDNENDGTYAIPAKMLRLR